MTKNPLIPAALAATLAMAFPAVAEESCLSAGESGNAKKVLGELLMSPIDNVTVSLDDYSADFIGKLIGEISLERADGMAHEITRVFDTMKRDLNQGKDLDFDRALSKSPIAARGLITELQMAGSVSADELQVASVRAQTELAKYVDEIQKVLVTAYESKASVCVDFAVAEPAPAPVV